MAAIKAATGAQFLTRFAYIDIIVDRSEVTVPKCQKGWHHGARVTHSLTICMVVIEL